MTRHLLLILSKLLLAMGIMYAMPAGFVQWGANYPGEGRESFAFVIWFTIFGGAVAVFFLTVGTVAQWQLRHTSWYKTLVFDASLFVILSSLLLFAGATAQFP